MRVLAQESHCDLGLIPDTDQAEDLKRPKKNAPDQRANAAGGEEQTPTHPLRGSSSMSRLPSTAEPGLPPGAQPDLWVGGQRDVYAQIGYVPIDDDLLQCPAVTVVAEQSATGQLGNVTVVLDVAMNHSHSGLTANEARDLASLLLVGAIRADEWAGLR